MMVTTTYNLKQKIEAINTSKNEIKSAIEEKIEASISENYEILGNIQTYANEISKIVTPNNQILPTITENGTYNYNDSQYTGFDNVTVNVNQSVQNKIITENGDYTADSGYIGLGTVTVNIQPDLDSKTITANGIYNASDDELDGYSSVTVAIPKEEMNYIIIDGESQNITDKRDNILLINAENLDDLKSGISYAHQDEVEKVFLSKITSINDGYGTFSAGFTSCSYLVEVDLSNLTSINYEGAFNSTFQGCVRLKKIYLSNLTTITGDGVFNLTFDSCSNLEQIDLSNLTTINGNDVFRATFNGCTKLSNVDLSKLTTLNGYDCLSDAFSYCSNLKTLSFPSLTSTSFGAYTNHFNYMLYGVDGCTVHFPSNLQSVIGSWSDVISGFGGTNTTVLFDLPATT